METPTRIEVPETDVIPSDRESHHKGWLTGEGYLAWVTTSEGVLASSCPISQPPVFSVEALGLDSEAVEAFNAA